MNGSNVLFVTEETSEDSFIKLCAASNSNKYLQLKFMVPIVFVEIKDSR